eukprot:scaffold272_cov160-Amphora_coffeaeformis.AAC.4
MKVTLFGQAYYLVLLLLVGVLSHLVVAAAIVNDEIRRDLGSMKSKKKGQRWQPTPTYVKWNGGMSSNKMKNSGKMKSSMKSGKMMGSKMKSNTSMYTNRKGKGHDIFRPMMTWKGKGKGKGVSPPDTTFVSADVSAATAENPIVLFSLAQEGGQIVVDLTLPNEQQVDGLYLVQGSDLQPGAPCPPATSGSSTEVPLTPGQETIRVSLAADTIVALCIDGFVVAQQYSIFETFDGQNIDEFPDTFVESIDVSNASVETPYIETVFFGSGVGRDIPGTFILYGSEPLNAMGGRRLLVDQFYAFPPNQRGNIGDPCPVVGAELLPSDNIYALTLLVLRSPEDQGVYGCSSGIIVSDIQLRYVGNDAPAPQNLNLADPTADYLYTIQEGDTINLVRSLDNAFKFVGRVVSWCTPSLNTLCFLVFKITVCSAYPLPFANIPFEIGSVGLRDAIYRTHVGLGGTGDWALDYNSEGSPPYTLADDNNGDYNPTDFDAFGPVWEIVCQAFCGPSLTGDSSVPVTRRFTVVA